MRKVKFCGATDTAAESAVMCPFASRYCTPDGLPDFLGGRAAPEGSRERSIRGGAHLECASCLQRLPAAAFSATELDADDGDATCLRCEGAPVGLYDGDVRGGENAWLAERQQKRRPPA